MVFVCRSEIGGFTVLTLDLPVAEKPNVHRVADHSLLSVKLLSMETYMKPFWKET